MRISHNWLKRYIDPRLSPQKLADGLSMLGLEVEKYEELGKQYEGFVVGMVVDRQKHPNADKLTVCTVDVGKEKLQIVCGAPNVTTGQKVAVGLVGATIPKNQHDPQGKPFVLQQIKIRGIESSGMICSEYELDLGEDKDGIMVLDPAARVGSPLAKYLGKNDVVYDMEVTANRGDWMSHFGVAREISAMMRKPWKAPAAKKVESKEPVKRHATVKVLDKKRCPRYVARVFRNVTIRPSPSWMQGLLTSVGVRPINNIVDITNFVMLETGQPLHAFDYDRLAGHAIVVRCAKEGEKFTTLDDRTRTLRSDTLMICDGERPVAIAGVMGGQNSEISDSTTNVLLESAFFDPVSIRKTSKYLGLSTEASQRFERSVDVDLTLYAANRAAELFHALAGAEVLKGAVDVYPKKRSPRQVALRVSRTNGILGTDLTVSQISSFLKRLGLRVRIVNAGKLMVSVPNYRPDLEEEIDLIEEVARIFGYDNIETKTETRINLDSVSEPTDLEDGIRAHMIGAGFNEMMTNSLQNKAHALMAGEPAVEVLNPVSIDMEMLRTSLIPGALDVIQHNYNHGQKGLRLFEYGKVYGRKEGGSLESLRSFHEEARVLIVLSGESFPQHYSVPSRQYDFLDLKGDVESLLSKFFLDKYRLIYYDNGKPLSVDNVDIEIQGTYAGFLGKLKKEVAAKFDIEEDVFVCELKAAIMAEAWQAGKKFSVLPRFPSVARDLAFVVDQRLPQIDIEEAIRHAAGSLLTNIKLFDVYVGEQFGAGKKSLAYALEFQPMERTLTDEEINAIVSRIVEQVRERCGATLRS